MLTSIAAWKAFISLSPLQIQCAGLCIKGMFSLVDILQIASVFLRVVCLLFLPCFEKKLFFCFIFFCWELIFAISVQDNSLITFSLLLSKWKMEYNFTGCQAPEVIIVYWDNAVSYGPKQDSLLSEITGPYLSGNFNEWNNGNTFFQTILRCVYPKPVKKIPAISFYVFHCIPYSF